MLIQLNRSLFFLIVFFGIMMLSGVLLGSRKQPVLVSYPTVFSTPTPVPSTPSVNETIVHSPDGTMEIVLQTTTRDGVVLSSTIATQTVTGEGKKVLYTTNDGDTLLLLPANSWSPDNTYVFVEEKKAGAIDWLVFKANGDAFASSAYLRIAPLFTDREKTLTLRDVTGWDSPTLLHVFTWESPGVKGPAFWFEVPSQSFIQLISS